MKPSHKNDRITEIMNDSEMVRSFIQAGINAALLQHKQAGNPVCEWKDGKVVWVSPENIPTGKDQSGK